ncbi:MAG: TIGR00282 family metallophosphoesterase [Alicyclobacillaceae bacterium]|nr:TIGR00282 family metallophosphoesterase [Alicyclobacillaceae bacterium]
MRILFIGDIVGSPGRQAVERFLPRVQADVRPDIVIANGENVAEGRGITPNLAEWMFDHGIDFITMGNHVWDHPKIFNFIDREKRLIRPANFRSAPGQGYTLCSVGGKRLAIVNVLGRAFMGEWDSPFDVLSSVLEEIGNEATWVFVDLHAEATSEKQAVAWHFDGRVTAVVGTHTHVQTADERILPMGTAYITDVGMTGPFNGIIGMKKEHVIRKMTTHLPTRFEVADGDVQFSAVVLDLDDESPRCVGIERILITPERQWRGI